MPEGSYLSVKHKLFETNTHDISSLQNKLNYNDILNCRQFYIPDLLQKIRSIMRAASSSSLLAFASAAVYMIDAHPAVCQIPLQCKLSGMQKALSSSLY